MRPVNYDPTKKWWSISGWNDAISLLTSSDASSDLRHADPGTASAELLPVIGEQANTILFQDGENHRRLRSAISSRFTRQYADGLRATVRDIAQTLCAKLTPPTADLVSEYARPLSLEVLRQILGLPGVADGDLIALARADLETFGFRKQSTFAIENGALLYLDQVLDGRIAATGLIEELLRSGQLSHTEIHETVVMVVRAGVASVADLLVLTIQSVLIQSIDRDRYLADATYREEVVEETLRMASPVRTIGRVTTAELHFGSASIPPRQTAMIDIDAANMDVEHFACPHEFRPERTEKPRHLSYGIGVHRCIGAHLGSMLAEEGSFVLFQNFPSMKSAPEGFEESSIPTFRGFENFTVDLCS